MIEYSSQSLSIGHSASLLGVSVSTLRRWNKLGKLNSFRTFGNHRRFHLNDILNIINPSLNQLHVAYARVSSHDQKKDLETYFNQDNILKTLVKDSKFFEYIEQYKTIRKEIVDTLIKNNPEFSYSCAHKFVNLFNNAGAVELMLLERSNTDLDSVHRVRNSIKIDDKNSQISQINIFYDNSMAIKKSSGDWININSKELKDSFIENFMYK